MRVRDGIFKLIGLCLVAGVLVAGLVFPAVGGIGLASNKASDTVDNISADLSTSAPPLVTNIEDKDGNPIATLYDQYRLPVADNQISQNMKAAIVAVEDKRFFDHSGVDWRGTLRAAANDATGGNTQGASTITQQYVKNYLVNVVDRNNDVEKRKDQEQTIARKLREARISIQLERRMSKDQILSGYLNVVAYSKSVYGIAAAAKVFFNTTADRLTVPQSALLAGIVNNPIVLNPWNNPSGALKRRNTVIDLMVANRALRAQDAPAAKAAPLGISPNPNLPSSSCLSAPDYAGFFCQYVEQYLDESGVPYDQVAAGGYTIRTTLDPKLSQTARASILKQMPQDATGVANAFAVVQPGAQSHNVLAMVSNRVLGSNVDNGETMTNSVASVSNNFGGGSSFKIFTSAAALEGGQAGLDTSLPNPGSTTVKYRLGGKYAQPYTVSNLGHYPDPISLREGLATSPNTAFVNLENQVGMPAVLNMAYRLGLRKSMTVNNAGGVVKPGSDNTQLNQTQMQYFQNLLSFTLGNSPVSPLEMANVSATIKSNGVWCPPNPIGSVTDRNGKPVQVRPIPCQQAVAPDIAHALVQGLSQDTISGTSAAAAKSAGWTRPDIGKTGTTQENKSVAFVGGVDDYAVSSMIFNDGPETSGICKGTPIHIGCGTSGAFGGTAAAPPYFDTFDQILAGQPSQPLPSAPSSLDSAGRRAPIVPFVLGMNESAAQDALMKAGYDHVVATEVPNESAKGTVIGVTPQGNVVTRQQITLFVSTGKP